MTARYLSEKFSKEQVEELFTTKGKIQMITAPTGAGKTYFVQTNVIKIAKGEFKPFGASQKKALLLANRSALITQIKEDLKNNLDATYFESINEEEYVNKYIDILSYQSLAKKILEDITFLEKYNLIIADECHYFLNDYWNNTTQLTLNELINHSVDNTILFFSATTEELKHFMDIIKDIEFDGRELYNEVLSVEESMDLGFNDRLDIVVTNDELENVMQQIPADEKFIIFVNEFMTKNKIEDLVKTMSTDKRAIGFMYSKWEQQGRGFKVDEEMAKKYDLTINNESFYDDYILGIIANNAMDNGVNLKMEDLKHIVLLNQYDFTQIKQFIGRKRHNPNNPEDRTNVYIISHNKAELEKIKVNCDKTMGYVKDYETLTKEEFMDKYMVDITLNSVCIPKYENSYLEGLKMLDRTKYNVKRNNDFPFMITFCFDGNVEIHPNYCQIQKVACKLNIINGVLEQLQYCTMAKFYEVNLRKYYKNVSIKEVKKSKSQKKYSALEEIPEYLDNLKGISINKEQYKKLREEFKIKWDVKHEKKFTVLGDKAFNEYISQFGYCIMKGKGKKVGNTIPTIYIIAKN